MGFTLGLAVLVLAAGGAESIYDSVNWFVYAALVYSSCTRHDGDWQAMTKVRRPAMRITHRAPVLEMPHRLGSGMKPWFLAAWS